jgi:4-hydroxy-2-oxoglutarate aldolase
MELRGIFVPAPTPFDPFTGDPDLVGLRRNVRAWMEAPLAGVVLFGTTGEGALLDEDERVRLLEGTREILEEGVLLAGAGAESTRAAIRIARYAAVGGADAVLVHPPSYYPGWMTPDALRDHFTAVADGSPVPVVLYRVPPNVSGLDLHPGLVGELSRHPNIVGIKDSTGSLKTLSGYLDACDRSCSVLAGSGNLLFAGLELGASGGIVAAAALVPHEAARMFERWTDGDPAAAGRIQERLIAPLDREIAGKLGVAGVKAALELIGLVGGPPRAPLKPLREKELARVREALSRAGLLQVSER